MNPDRSHAVAVTGLGCLSSAGVNVDQLLASCMDGKTGIRNGRGLLATYPTGERPRAVAFALEAIRQAVLQAEWGAIQDTDGFIVASTTSLVSEWERLYLSSCKEKNISLAEFENIRRFLYSDELLREVVREMKFKGPTLFVSSACSASTQAIAIARQWILSGKVQRCLVGGVETASELTEMGFGSFQLLSSEPARPFDRNRKGINLSEGAAMICLEKAGAAKALGWVIGAGMRSDAFHMTAPHPEGRGCRQAISAALRDAGLEPKKIQWVHAHGTGSQANDEAEASALEQLGIEAPVTSTKSIHGHMLAAAGALESIICIESLRRKILVPTWGCESVDEKIKINVLKELQERDCQYVLKTTLGFGGANAALIFSGGNS